jgi:hypothetical protein
MVGSKIKKLWSCSERAIIQSNDCSLGEVRSANIIASFNPTYARRVIIAAHWDTRHASDEDAKKPKDPFDGADDGGSGVAILLEIARC